MQNYYEIPSKNKHYNPVVETMNNNYQSIYQNFDPTLFNSQSTQNLPNQNFEQNKIDISQNNPNQNQANVQSNYNQTQSNANNQSNNAFNNSNNMNNNISNIANMLNSFGGNNNYMDIIKTISGGGFNGDKSQMILNLLSNMNNKVSNQNKKTTTQSSDFLSLTSIEDYNFID